MSNATAIQDKRVFEAAARRGAEQFLDARMTTARKRILSLEAVLERVPVSRTTLWRMERAGLFPRRVQVSANRVGWIETDVEAWVDGRKRDHANND